MAQYFTDFSEYTTGQQPSNWTKRWNTGGTWTVENDGGATGGKLLKFNGDGGGDNRQGFSWDEIDGDANRDDAELLMRVRLPVGGDTASGHGRMLLRGSGATGSETGYTQGIDRANNNVALRRYINGNFNQRDIANFTVNSNTWYWVRGRINGTVWTVKAWSGTIDDEPAGWDLTFDTDGNSDEITGVGWVGVFRFEDVETDYDFVGVGTNGDTAPAESLGYTLSITSANGTVTKDPDKTEYDPDEVVELTADPDAGYKFDSWGGDITSTSNPVNVTMDADKSITANYSQIDNITPEDGATGISLTPILDFRPDLTFSGYDNYLVQLTSDADFSSPPFLIDEIVSQDELQVLVGVLDNLTLYRWRVFGARINFDTTVYSEDFAGITDGQPWPSPWNTADQAANGNVSFDVTGERARIVTTGPSVFATADLEGIDIEDSTQEFLIRSDLISNGIQPSYYFRTTGFWQTSGKRTGYQFWFWDQKVHLVKTDSEYNNSVLKEVAQALSANTDYRLKYQTNGSLIQWKLWQDGQAEPSSWNEYNDTDNPHLSGRFAIKLVTTGSAGNVVMEFDDFSIQQAEEVPVIESIGVGDTELTVNHSEVTNADSYEYRLDGGTATTANSTNGSFTITGLTNGQEYSVEMRAIVSGSPTSWSNAVSETPQADSIQSVTINEANADVGVNQQITLTTTIETTGSPDTSLTWSSSDTGIATVTNNNDGTATVQGVAEGSVIISAQSVADNTKSDSVSGTVSAGVTIEDSAAADKQTLADLYVATGGDWETQKTHFHPGDDSKNQGTEGYYNHTGNATGWSSDPAQINLDPGAGTIPFGVETEEIGGEWRVVSLKLNSNSDVGWDVVHRKSNDGTKGGNNLTGTIGPNFDWQLYQCRYVNLKHNYINFQIPKKLFTPNLEVFRMNGTYEDMVPETPPTVSNKANWVDRSNFITGGIPVEIGNATSLDIFVARGRWWGEGDEEAGGGQTDFSDQYALGGAIPNEIVNAPIKKFDVRRCRFNDFPNQFNSALEEFEISSLWVPGTTDSHLMGMGISRLNALGGLPNLQDINLNNAEIGKGTTDKGPFPDWSENIKLDSVNLANIGMEAEIPEFFTDGSLEGALGGGLREFVVELNPGMIGPLPFDAGGFGFGFSHRFGRTMVRLSGCGFGGPFPPDWIDPGVVQLDLSGNQFTGTLHSLVDWTQLLDLRNFYIAGNNFDGGLPYFDWYNTRERGNYPNHPLEAFSRITINNNNLDMGMMAPQQPWELQQRTRRWYYDNKSNIISNVDPDYTNTQYKQHYSAAYWDSLPGTTGYEKMENLLSQIYQGWEVKDF